MTYNPKLGPEDPPRAPAQVFISCPDALAADSLRASLATDLRIALVASAAEAEVIVWDLGVHGADSTGAALNLPPATGRNQPLLALVADVPSAQHALQHGALGVLQRRADPMSLSAAVIAVRLGLCVLDAQLAEHYLELPEPSSLRDTEPLETLTAREHEVLALLALGLSNKAIAERLQVSLHTAKFHVNSILAKLGVESRTGAVTTALRRGLVAI